MTVAMDERLDDSGRVASRWWPIHWTSPLVGETPRPISLFDLAELRGVVDTNRVAAGLDPIRWLGRTDDDPSFVAGSTPIRAVHFTQLRAAIGDLWSVAGLGRLPEFRAGPIVTGTRAISVRDPLDLRGWIEAYELARPELAARVAWRYPTEEPWLWPATDHRLAHVPPVEVWDVTGHALFWRGRDQPFAISSQQLAVGGPPAGGSGEETLTELRRIDTHWHRVDAYPDGDNPAVTMTPDSRVVANAPTAVALASTPSTLIEDAGLRFLKWEPTLPTVPAGGTVERDGFGRVVRILDGDTVVLRLAYDGLGRLRKWVDATTWHVVGPGVVLPIAGAIGGSNPNKLPLSDATRAGSVTPLLSTGGPTVLSGDPSGAAATAV